jgi:hypothetical protein
VISVEFVTHGYGPEWIQKCIELLGAHPNWIPIAYFTGYQGNPSWAPHPHLGSDAVYRAASYQCATHRNYALIDPSYLLELDTFISNLVNSHQVDIAFVDPGIYLRGDLVQRLFHKVSVIVAHDCRRTLELLENDVYGYSRIYPPDDYEEILIPFGQGTTVWIIRKENFLPLIDAIKKYASPEPTMVST